jgi:phosphoribosylglycinamide formyltransferase-1
MSGTKRIVVLISGNGSNLQAIIDACTAGGQQIDASLNASFSAEIACVISNKPDAFGLERARNANIATLAIDHRQFGSREAFDAEQPDLVVLAGFMRILTAEFVTHFRGRLINIHPSLLPKYTGLHTHRRALEAGDAEHGATVHFVTEQLDGGPAIMQARIAIKPEDTEQSVAARLLLQEHALYPLAVKWFIDGRLQLDDNRVLLDGNVLPTQGFQYTPTA